MRRSRFGAPCFSPEQAMVAFKKLFGSLVSFTTPIPIRAWRFMKNVILRQYLEVKYGYVVEVCGFYAVILLGIDIAIYVRNFPVVTILQQAIK